MADFFEIDFLDVETRKSGDAITLRYRVNDRTFIHVVDGGFIDTGEKIIRHLQTHYDAPAYIDHVVVTHPDGDHAAGLRSVLEEYNVGALWMLRPWFYASHIIHRFSRFTSVDGLIRRLKEIYPHLAALEEIAIRRGIPIFEPFQGQSIGAFTVLAPTPSRYLDLIVDSERTPETIEESHATALDQLGTILERAAAQVVNFVRAVWGEEVFSTEETSAENEMSVVQFAYLSGHKILLTGDTGRAGLLEAALYAPLIGLNLPGIDRFQVPHHGSRRNISTALLDHWVGPRLANPLPSGQERFTAVISSAKADPDHPRKAVVRAFIHRGAKVVTTEGKSLRTHQGAGERAGWSAAVPLTYPEDQES